MRVIPTLLLLVGSVACAADALALNEYGIEGMGRVSTRADEAGASVSADGRWIVFASNRGGGAGGWDLWQARLEDKRWSQPQPLSLNSAADERAPFFSADGRWLYFASSRAGGQGGLDMYRVAVNGGRFGRPEPLTAANSTADDSSPGVDTHGQLLFASNRGGSWGLWRSDAATGARPQPLPGPLDRAGNSLSVLVLGERGDLVLARDAGDGRTRLHHGYCQAGQWQDGGPLPLSFNDGNGLTQAAGVDHSAPAELLLAGSARAPRAGGLDIYRTRAPLGRGDGSCR